MNVGFIGFGEVSYTLSKIFYGNGYNILTSVDGRSIKTKDLVGSIDYIQCLSDFEEVAKKSDILISANSPNSALAIALKYGPLTEGIFLDFNNISPDTSKSIGNFLTEDHFVDSAIMGKVQSDEINIFLSGKLSKKVANYFSNGSNKRKDNDIDDISIKITIVSDNIGDVSCLKVLRSIYTKGVSALLIETFETAEVLGLDETLWEILNLTENSPFIESSKSRIINSYKSSKRKYEELEEILDFVSLINDDELDNLMVEVTRDKFQILKNRNE